MGAGVGCSSLLKVSKLSSKFLLFLLFGWGAGFWLFLGNSRVLVLGRGGGNFFFFLVEFRSPMCFIRVSFPSIFTKIFWP